LSFISSHLSSFLFLCAFAKLQKAAISVVCMEQVDFHWMDFHEIKCLSSFHKSVKKIQVSLKSDKIMGILHGDRYTFLITSHSVLLRMRSVLDKGCRENQNTFYVQYHFFQKLCCLWDNCAKVL
jgi:hypothetical protein